MCLGSQTHRCLAAGTSAIDKMEYKTSGYKKDRKNVSTEQNHSNTKKKEKKRNKPIRTSRKNIWCIWYYHHNYTFVFMFFLNKL